MEFRLSEEQEQLASTMRSLLAKHSDSAAVRAAMDSEGGYDPPLWELLCEQIGVAALAVPEKYGGAGFSVFETLVVLDELGRSLAPSPLLATLVAGEALLSAGDDETCARLLPRIAAGEIATIAWSGTRGPGLEEPVRARGTTLTGTVTDVLSGDLAEVLLVAARTETGVALFEVDPAAVTRTWTPAMDTTLRLATLSLENTPATLVIADASTVLARARLVGTVGVAALQVGCAQRGLEMTVAYAKERQQFGRPIGSFQALKHRMADMLVLVEMSRSAFWAAAYALSVASPDAERLAAVAGSYCSDSLTKIASETVQLHGGIAITWEHDAQLVLKRAHALGQLFGQAHQHRRQLL